jgi:hypothetical protein
MSKWGPYSSWDRAIIFVLCVIVSGYSFKHAYDIHIGAVSVSIDQCSAKGRLFCHIGNLIFEKFGNDGVAGIYVSAGLFMIAIINMISRESK